MDANAEEAGPPDRDVATDEPRSLARLLGSGWLLAWLTGAVAAWLLPWTPVAGKLDMTSALRWLSWLRRLWLELPGASSTGLWLGLLILLLGLVAGYNGCGRARYRWARWVLLGFAVVVGLGWSLAQMTGFRQQQLALALPRIDAEVTGRVVGLPVARGDHIRFVLQINRVLTVTPADARLKPGSRILLNDYRPPSHGPMIHGGRSYRLVIRLKPPHGSANPGGFDYERWLFRQHIIASGYLKGRVNALPSQTAGWLDRLRADLRNRLQHEAASLPTVTRGLMIGLTLGDRSQLPAADWATLLATGTNHLLAISGLHVGLVAGLFAWIAAMLWRWTRWCDGFPAQRVAALAAILAAWIYALIAGLSIPTERAAVMLTLLLAGILIGRRWRLLDLWLLAAFTVLLLDPFAPLGAGFWLSFLAVLLIILWIRQRPGRAWWISALQLQLVLTVALGPVVWWLFGRIAWSAMPANLLAVPLVSFLLTPLSLASLLFVGWAPSVVVLIAHLVAGLAAFLFMVLGWLAVHLPGTRVAPPPLFWLLLALAGVLWWLMPSGWPGRYRGLLLCLPAVCYRPPTPSPDHAGIWVFDVGQGLACLVRTQHHALLYDTGPAHGDWDAGKREVLPALRTLGVARVDRIVISHAARDHDGGLASVHAAFPAAELISGEPLAGFSTAPCRDGEHWSWDGVRFRLMHAAGMTDDNDRSCVLEVSERGGSTLLTGDIEAPAERWLVRHHDLSAEWLYVPHHGSTTSSTPAFIAAVRPREALVSAGYHNRYGHPAASVLARYRRHGIPVLDTARDGALRIADGGVQGYRAGQWPFVWRRHAINPNRSGTKKSGQ